MVESGVKISSKLAIKPKGSRSGTTVSVQAGYMNGPLLNKSGSLFLAKFAVALKHNYNGLNGDYRAAVEKTLRKFVHDDVHDQGRLLGLKDMIV